LWVSPQNKFSFVSCGGLEGPLGPLKMILSYQATQGYPFCSESPARIPEEEEQQEEQQEEEEYTWLVGSDLMHPPQ